MRRVSLVVPLLVLALTSCELRGEINVNDDGSGTFGMRFGVERSLRDMAGPGQDPLAQLRADLADDPVKWKITEYSRGDLAGIYATFDFSSTADLKDKMRLLSSKDDRGPSSTFGDFTLTREGEGWVFTGSSSNDASSDGELPIPAEQLDKILQLQLRITLPGKAKSTNADDTSYADGKTTFIWSPRLAEATRAPQTLSARTVGVGGAFPLAPVAGVLAIVGVAAVVLLLARGRTTPPGHGVFYMDQPPLALRDDALDPGVTVPGPEGGTDEPNEPEAAQA